MDKIDIVIPWVDPNDKNWQNEKSKYTTTSSDDNRNIRYRDWENLKYLFRSIEKNASWVNKVFFVTCGQKPKWLNTKCKKLVMINHKDFIPKEYLPTFSSHTIELNLHRINELSDTFIYFNDDIFIINKTKKQDFFKKGLPCDSAILGLHIANTRNSISSIVCNNMEIINTTFNKNKVLKENKWKWFNPIYGMSILRTFCLLPWKYFAGFYNQHLPISYKKSTYQEVWNQEYNLLNQTCMNKFRSKNDVNQWLFRYWQLVTGKFTPRCPKIGKSVFVKNNENDVISLIKSKKYKIICINDTEEIKDFEKMKQKINQEFEKRFPEKSSFEK